MSISQRIQEAKNDGRLVAFTLEFDSDPAERAILLHPQLAADLSEQVEPWGKRVGRLQADFERFVTGQHVSLSMTPYKHKSAYMGLLDPASEGTWEIRSCDPNPGLRVFGKFAYVDTFVALNWEPRSVGVAQKRPLGTGKSLEYQIAMIEANQRWDAVLPDLTPLTGGRYIDYVSKNSSEV